jgi:hypothetical protein
MGAIEVTKHDPQAFRTLDALDDHDLLATTQEDQARPGFRRAASTAQAAVRFCESVRFIASK